MSMALETRGLGKRFGGQWALRDCTLQVPTGSIAALVGPNGAGKTTLMQMAVGLLHPTAGEVFVAGKSPWSTPGAALAALGYVAQDHPLYRGYQVAEIFQLGRRLNARWDQSFAEQRMAELGIPLQKRVGQLSGGQQAQVALTLALAKRPEVLLLDEPVASLDPLARRNFLRTLMDAAAAGGLTIVLSSHLITDLERVCDYMILLDTARVRLVERIEDILAAHRRLVGPAAAVDGLATLHTIISSEVVGRQANLIVRTNGPVFDPAWDVQPVALEEIVIAYLEQRAHPVTAGTTPQLEVVS